MQRNLLLSALPELEQQRLRPFLTHVHLDTGQILVEADRPIQNVYFPETAVASSMQLLENGSSVECGLTGREGFVGAQLWLLQESTPSSINAQVPGQAWRMSSADFVRHVRDTGSPLNPLLARYVNALLVMASQVAACNRLHHLDARLCRWLSMISNRVGDEFPMSHEYLAIMLGVGRPTVSTTAKILQRAGVIDYSRGHIRVLDRNRLSACACECYDIIEAQVGSPWVPWAPSTAKPTAKHVGFESLRAGHASQTKALYQ